MENQIPGVKTHSGSNTYYWNIVGGRFARRVKEGEGEKRITKTNRVVYEHFADGITGALKSIMISKTDFGDQIVIELTPAPGYLHVIQIPKDSRFATTFLERLPHLRYGDVIELRPYSFENEKGDRVSGMLVYLNDEKLESFYRFKDGDKWKHQNGFPEFPDNWQELSEKKRKIYFIEVDEFLTNELHKWVMMQESQEEKESDLPF